MKTKIYLDDDNFIAGMTLKSDHLPENNNMALHSCISPETVLGNRKSFTGFIGFRLNDLVCARQTHSANFHEVTAAEKGKGADRMETAIPDTDALYTYEPDLVLASFSADCVPVMFWNRKEGLIGVIHSGWQGTVKEITSDLFDHLIQERHCRPEDFRIQLGAALSQERFEVDEDVFKRFHALGYADEFIYFNEETHKYHIDNQLTVKRQCELAGIPPEQIAIDRTCTFGSAEGFSYRQNRQAGRHMSFMVRKSG
ncbi:polyphenol oxidase family protein [Indiicoccus explosivorum]|uniref:polyphenol oxidase family protein n=1 Tax=Indiicoccus explosivorum TaxID=1917864 RepID=UPI000B4439F5|nr:polyphenol oxidase family protein [Indiicoccus explosivorum]